ncbi:hypothetical protein LXL04_037678 [Taraxacum kok-saghyz]
MEKAEKKQSRKMPISVGILLRPDKLRSGHVMVAADLWRKTEEVEGLFTNCTIKYSDNSFNSHVFIRRNLITYICSSLSSNTLLLETETMNRMRSDLKRKSGLPLKILLDTEARVKV